jgi:poly-beta-1,6-N-acetyl-D-glucosamine synthase
MRSAAGPETTAAVPASVPVPGPTRWITVLVPAHNEAATIEATLASLQRQTRTPDRVVVIADNCSDQTAQLAERQGAEVLETVANRDKKAGGLNQALEQLLPDSSADDLFLVMDADTTLGEKFLAAAEAAFLADDSLGAAGGLFYGDPGSGIIGGAQRNEYHRYQRESLIKGGAPMVLTGTASVFSGQALKAVAEARGLLIPGKNGQVYDTLALTEDNELTIALKTLGWQLASPADCAVSTEVMPNLRSLWRQRERWQRGALENLRNYGWTPTTRAYWLQQFMLTYGVLALWSFVILTALTALAATAWSWSFFWLLITGIFIVERVMTVWGRGRSARVVAALLIPELAYDAFIQAVFVKALFDFARRSTADWNHVPREALS